MRGWPVWKNIDWGGGGGKGIHVINLSIKTKSVVFVHSSIHQDFGNDLFELP